MPSISKATEISNKPTHRTNNQPNAGTTTVPSGVGQVRPTIIGMYREPQHKPAPTDFMSVIRRLLLEVLSPSHNL